MGPQIINEETAAADARNMIRHLNGKKLPIWLDLEWAAQGVLGKDKVTAIAKAYLNTCRSLGYCCHIYSNLDWYKNKYHSDEAISTLEDAILRQQAKPFSYHERA